MLRTPRRRRSLVVGLTTALWWAPPLAALDTPSGLPLIRSVVPPVEEASPQSFGLAVDPRGLLYVANLNGLLVHDGASWVSLAIGDAGTAMAVAVDAAGRVAVGGQRDFGLVEADATGRLYFSSLASRLPAEQREFGQVLDIVARPEGFAFLTQRWLWRWDGQSVAKVAEFPETGPLPGLYSCRGEAYVWSSALGLGRLVGDQVVAVPGGEAYRDGRIRAVLEGPGESVLVVQRESGLSLFAHGRRTPFAPEASAWAGRARAIVGTTLPTGGWALGSVLDGILTLSPDGRVDRLIDTAHGLPDDFVSDLAVDHEGALWAALNSDLVRIEASLPLSAYDRRSGIEGSPYSMIRHQGTLYVATAAGLFGAAGGAVTADTPPFQPVPGFKPSVWSLMSRGDDLLVGTSDGLVSYRRGSPPRPIAGFEATVYTLTAPPEDPDVAWLGLDDGFAVVRRKAGRWELERHLDSPSPVRAIESRAGRLWLATENHGIFFLELPLAPPGQEQPRQVAGGLGTGAMFAIGGEVVVPADDRLMRLDAEHARLVPAPELARLSEDDHHGFLREDAAGNVWRASQPLSIVLAGWSGAASPAVRTLPELPVRSVEFFFLDDDGAVWLGAENGLYRWGGAVAEPSHALAAPLLESVVAGSAVLRSGRPAAPPATIDLSPSLRRLRLNFAPLSFQSGLRFQSRLDPLDNDWSTASPEPFSELTRLAPGDYTFRVRTVRSQFEIGPETRWSFRVLPPWYRTPWAYAAALGLALLGLRGYGHLRSRTHAQRAARLQAQVDLQTIELRQTVDELRRTQDDLQNANGRLEELSQLDELTGVANRRRLRTVLEAEWGRAARHDRPISFVLLDLDQFKLLNDSRGHHEGDRCLQRVAQYLDGAVRRRTDLLVRYGGEEFAVLLPDTDLPGALEVAEKLREGIEELAIPHEAVREGRITASFGVATLVPLVGQRPEILIEAADRALYRAKAEGRNRVLAEGEPPGFAIAAAAN